MSETATGFGRGRRAGARPLRKRDLPGRSLRESASRGAYWYRAFTAPQDAASFATMQLDVWEPRYDTVFCG